MGIHDRDYMQAGAAPGPLYRPGRLTWLIIAINGVLWIVYSMALNNVARGGDPALLEFFFYQLELHPDAVFERGKVWQLFTNFWLHDPSSAQHVIFNMLALFFFGRAVETFLGPKRFLALYIGAGLFASLVLVAWHYGSGENFHALGASGAVFAVLVWMACQRPKATVYLMMVIPMPMWLAVGVFILGIEFLQLGGVFGSVGTAIAHLSGAAFGAAYWFFLPRFSGGGNYRQVEARPQTRSTAPGGLEEAHRLTAMRMAMDRLLDKVHNEGMDSLTEEEKAFLEQAARELRGR